MHWVFIFCLILVGTAGSSALLGAEQDVNNSSFLNVLSLGLVDYGLGITYERMVTPQFGALYFVKGYYNYCAPCGEVQSDDTGWYGVGVGGRYYFKRGFPKGWALGVQGSQEYIQEYLIHRDGATVWSENDIGKMFIVSTLMSYRWIFLGHWVLEPAVGSGIWFLESGAKTYSGMVTAGSTDLLGTVELKTGVIF